MGVQKYRKKPVVVEAIEWKGSDPFGPHEGEVFDFYEDAVIHHSSNVVSVYTREGEMYANVGDYIVKGVNGEFYPCGSEIFHLTYEPVSE